MAVMRMVLMADVQQPMRLLLLMLHLYDTLNGPVVKKVNKGCCYGCESRLPTVATFYPASQNESGMRPRKGIEGVKGGNN